MIEVRIGVIDAPKELSVDIDGDDAEWVKSIESKVSDGSGMLWLKDKKGKQIGIPVTKIAYVEVIPEAAGRVAGFGRGD